MDREAGVGARPQTRLSQRLQRLGREAEARGPSLEPVGLHQVLKSCLLKDDLLCFPEAK